MFEKEAYEYREKGKRDGYYLVTQEMEQEALDYIIDETFKDAAEFGFQKGIKARINTTTISDCPIKDEKLAYAKNIIQDLLDNSDEYARQRAIDYLKESD